MIEPIRRQGQVRVIRLFRVTCPQCGDHPDSPFETMVDARDAQRRHFQDHRDGRI